MSYDLYRVSICYCHLHVRIFTSMGAPGQGGRRAAGSACPWATYIPEYRCPSLPVASEAVTDGRVPLPLFEKRAAESRALGTVRHKTWLDCTYHCPMVFKPSQVLTVCFHHYFFALCH